jgi:hypothetical protein
MYVPRRAFQAHWGLPSPKALRQIARRSPSQYYPYNYSFVDFDFWLGMRREPVKIKIQVVEERKSRSRKILM